MDQKNDPNERGTETLLSVIAKLGLTYPAPVPMVWLIHVISPSAYDDTHFNDLCAEMAERNIGVICCPSAALSMRQLRPRRTPTHDSIARVMEFLAAGDSVEDVLEEYPALKRDDVQACLDYASKLMANHYSVVPVT